MFGVNPLWHMPIPYPCRARTGLAQANGRGSNVGRISPAPQFLVAKQQLLRWAPPFEPHFLNDRGGQGHFQVGVLGSMPFTGASVKNAEWTWRMSLNLLKPEFGGLDGT